MNQESISEIYSRFLKDSVLLQNGKEYLENLLTVRTNFMLESLDLFLRSNESLQTKKYIGILIKNLLKDNWDTSKEIISNQKIIRESLIRGVSENLDQPKIIEIIGLIISDLIIRDGLEYWLEHIKGLINLLISNENVLLSNTLELFCILFSKVDNRIHIFAPMLIPLLFQFITKENDEIIQEKILVLFYLILSSFSFADGTNNVFVKETLDSTFDKWIELFFQVLQSFPNKYINCKRYVMKILTILFRDFPYYTKPYLKQVVMGIWIFYHKLPHLFCLNVINDIPIKNLDENLNIIKQTAQTEEKTSNNIKRNTWEDNYLEDEDDWDYDVEGLTIQVIELFLTILNKPEIQPLIFCGLYPLTQTTLNFLFTTKKQEKKWISDPNQFISEDEDEENIKSTRNICLKLLSYLIENFSQAFLPIFLHIIENSIKIYNFQEKLKDLDYFYNEIQKSEEFEKCSKFYDIKTLFISSAYDCHMEAHGWKQQEAGFLILGSFLEDILDYNNNYHPDFNIELLIKNILNQIQKENVEKLVLARGLWCLSKFSPFLEKNNQEMLLNLCNLSINCLLNCKEIALKLIAAKSTSSLLFKIWKLGLFEEIKAIINFPAVIKEFIELFNIVSEETVHIILEGLQYILKIVPEQKSIVSSAVAPYIFKLFQLFHNEVLIGTLIQELIENLLEDEQGMKNILDTFCPLIMQIFKTFQTHLNLEREKLRTIIKPTDISLITNLMDILKLFVKSKSLANLSERKSLLELLPILFSISLYNEDVAMSVHANICLKYFIISFKDELKNKFLFDTYWTLIKIIKNSYSNDLLSFLHKITELNSNENCLLYLGNLILITFQDIFAGANNLEIVKNLLLKLHCVKTPSVIQNLLLVFSRMISLNSQEAFEFLYSFQLDPNTRGLTIFIDKILAIHTVIKGKHSKNSIYYALTKLFLLNDARLNEITVSSTKAPLKILSLLTKVLDDEVNNKVKIRTMDFDEDFVNSPHTPSKELENLDDLGNYYEGEEYDDTMGQIDEENDNKMISEDLIYLNDISTKFELQDILKEFFEEIVKSSKNCLNYLSNEEKQILEKHLNIS